MGTTRVNRQALINTTTHMRFHQYFQLLSEMRAKVVDQLSELVYLHLKGPDVELTNSHYIPGEGSAVGTLDQKKKTIFFNTQSHEKGWAYDPFGHNKKLIDVLKAVNTKIALQGYSIHVGKAFNGTAVPRNLVGTYEEVVQSKDILQSRNLTLYHGTNSIYWEQIKKTGLQSTFATGNMEWGNTGKYYKGKKPLYLATTAERAHEYAQNAFENNPKGHPIVLKVTVPMDESRLFADDDFLDSQEDKNIHAWRKSLKETGQLVYIGRIPANSVELVYPDEIPEHHPVDFKKVETIDDVAYGRTMKQAFKAGVDHEKIHEALLALRDTTYDMDEWETVNEKEFDYDYERAAVKMCEYFDENVDWEMRERLPFEYYKDVDEFWEAWLEHDGDMTQAWEFEDNDDGKEDLEKLEEFATIYQDVVRSFARWRAKLFSR